MMLLESQAAWKVAAGTLTVVVLVIVVAARPVVAVFVTVTLVIGLQTTEAGYEDASCRALISAAFAA